MQPVKSALARGTYGTAQETEAIPFEQVLHQELDAIDRSRELRRGPAVEKRRASDADDSLSGACERALRSNLVGLSFSGGGIRSATFNLGVLQALAELGLLKRLDYLSTVSGGGYIGSWLTGLIYRTYRRLRDAQGGEDHRGDPGEDAICEVEARIRSDRTDRVEDDAVRFLRSYSNYLTPKVGLFSADTWAVVTTYLRNLLLNLVILISGFSLILLVPRLLRYLARALEVHGLSHFWLLLPALLLAVLAFGAIGVNIGSFAREVRERWGPRDHWLTQGGVQRWIVLPLLAVAGLLTAWLQFWTAPWSARTWMLWGAVAYAGLWSLACVGSRFRYGRWTGGVGWQALIASAVVAGLVGGGALGALDLAVSRTGPWQALVWGPPLILFFFFLLAALQTGVIGRNLQDHQREWLSRLGAWLLIYALGWLGLAFISTCGTVFYFWAGSYLKASMVVGWLSATGAGLLAGRGSEAAAGRASRIKVLIAKVAPYVFVVGLLIALAIGVDLALSGGGDSPQWRRLDELSRELAESRQASGQTEPRSEAAPASRPALGEFFERHFELLEASPGGSAAALALGLLGALVAVGWRVDINEFSMHRLYRNRLVRCYLGASVDREERERQRQPFTGFSDDDLLLGDLGPGGDASSKRGYGAPLHLVNTALNMVKGRKLAWQERKAASFVLSPLFSGFDTGVVEQPGYRRTLGYASHPQELTLGSAVAISGAAASPNMGFRTSPPLSFLLTVFNVRLGWWLGNPSSLGLEWKRSGPVFAPWHLIREVFGLTREDSRYVYLSDGGHFENLGIYELVRRRCRLVIASDAGADPGLRFDDLGNAIRKCRSDLGIEIDLRPGCIRRRGDDRYSSWHCAVGTIHYDRLHPGLGKGTILYLKSSLTGDEPEDLLNYGQENPEFPHQTTADQWFEESQFESYRRLGRHVAHHALDDAVAETEAAGKSFNSERLAQRLRQRWYPPTTVPADAVARYGAVLDRLYDRLRRDQELAFLDQQFYPEWQSLIEGEPASATPLWLPSEPALLRAGFYFCNELIQLMENVYLELQLEHAFAHPDNRGWMNLFKHWSWSGMLQATWSISASTYGKRFQNFCERRLGLQVLQRIGDHRLSIRELGSRSRLIEAVRATPYLNFLEKDIVTRFERANPERLQEVVAFCVEVESGFGVDSPERRHRMRFGIGFALVDRDGYLMCFRIQDHLRKMGLGRLALIELLDTTPIKGVRTLRSGVAVVEGRHPDGPAWIQVPEDYQSEFSEAEMHRFLALYRSVRQERAGEGSA